MNGTLHSHTQAQQASTSATEWWRTVNEMALTALNITKVWMCVSDMTLKARLLF